MKIPQSVLDTFAEVVKDLMAGGVGSGRHPDAGKYKPIPEHPGMEIARDKDFQFNGTHHVYMNRENYKVYRDPESGWWYEDKAGHFTQNLLGFSKKEALQSIADKHKDIKSEEQPLKDQKKEWPLQGHTMYQGLKICIENKKGSIRSGKEPNGKPWSIKMPFDYGYVASTKGVDGDEVDCFIGSNPRASHIFIVHQKQNKSGEPKYDEDKCFLGWNSADAAKKAYHSAFNNVDLFHSMTMMSIKEFKQKLKSFSGKKLHASLQAGGEGSGRHKSNVDRKLKQILQKEWKDQTDEERRYVALKDPSHRQNKLFDEAFKLTAGGPGSGRHKEAFNAALKYVKENHADLLKHANKIIYREHNDPGATRTGAFFNNNRNIHVFKRETSTQTMVRSYVRTLVHELTHAKQNVEGKPYSESEARMAGDKAAESYDRSKDIKAGGPGSGRHPSGRKEKEPASKKLHRQAKFLQKHNEAKSKDSKRRYDEAQAKNKAEGKNARGKEIVSTKQKLAVKSMVVISKTQQDAAEKGEQLVAKALGGTQSSNNSPMDVTTTLANGKLLGLEVKSMLVQTQDRIYIKGNALTRKTTWGKANKAQIGTVALDFRNNSSKPDVYYRSGVGAFHIRAMTPVEGGLKGLLQAIGGK